MIERKQTVEVEWGGKTWLVYREPRHIEVRQKDSISDVWSLFNYGDEFYNHWKELWYKGLFNANTKTKG
jgi:hypothetical protein